MSTTMTDHARALAKKAADTHASDDAMRFSQAANNLMNAEATAAMLMREQGGPDVKTMVDRFLAWKLPADFNPDGGISFDPIGNKNSPYEYRNEPVGTNLLTATQAEAMIRHLLG